MEEDSLVSFVRYAGARSSVHGCLHRMQMVPPGVRRRRTAWIPVPSDDWPCLSPPSLCQVTCRLVVCWPGGACCWTTSTPLVLWTVLAVSLRSPRLIQKQEGDSFQSKGKSSRWTFRFQVQRGRRRATRFAGNVDDEEWRRCAVFPRPWRVHGGTTQRRRRGWEGCVDQDAKEARKGGRRRAHASKMEMDRPKSWKRSLRSAAARRCVETNTCACDGSTW